jgi:flagellar basal-body rod protein FlgB
MMHWNSRSSPATVTDRIDALLQVKQAPPVARANVKYRTEFQPNVDGNTVNMDVERAAFAENAVQMEAMLTFIRSA